MPTKKKNSLVANINRRKKAGTSRARSKSTVSPSAYRAMRKNWGRTRKAGGAKKSTRSKKR